MNFLDYLADANAARDEAMAQEIPMQEGGNSTFVTNAEGIRKELELVEFRWFQWETDGDAETLPDVIPFWT